MRLFDYFCTLLLLALIALASTATSAEEMYKLHVGGTVTGMREQKAQDVQLGVEAAFNQIVGVDNMVVNIDIYNNTQDFYQAIKNKKLAVVFSSPIEYLGIESELLSKPLICGVINGVCKSRIILLVRKDSSYSTLQHLRAKSISIPQWILNDDGGLFLENALLEKNEGLISHFFSKVNIVSTSNRAIANVFFKTTEAALVREVEFDIANELNPQLKQQLQVIEASEPFVMITMAASKNFDQSKLSLLSRRVIDLSNSKKGKTVLSYLHMSGFAELPQSELNSTRELIKKNKLLKARYHSDLY